MNHKLSRGFTFIELMMVMGIITILFGVSTINLFKTKHKTSLNAAIAILVNDMKAQQLKAMSGDTEGMINHDTYGIRFETHRYMLFRGPYYTSGDPANFPVTLEEDIQIDNISWPDNKIVFASVSGEIANFSSGNNTMRIKSIYSDDQKTIIINRYGVVTSIN